MSAEVMEVLREVVRRLEALAASLEEVRREAARTRMELRPAEMPPEQQTLAFPRLAGPPTEQLVTLDQMAAIVRLRKRSLERHRKEMPPPAVKGGGGRPALWSWPDVRPWLEGEFGMRLPETFPAFAG